MLVASLTSASKMLPELVQTDRERPTLAAARAKDTTAMSQRHTALHEARITRQILGPAAKIA